MANSQWSVHTKKKKRWRKQIFSFACSNYFKPFCTKRKHATLVSVSYKKLLIVLMRTKLLAEEVVCVWYEQSLKSPKISDQMFFWSYQTTHTFISYWSIWYHFCVLLPLIYKNEAKTQKTFWRGYWRHGSETALSFLPYPWNKSSTTCLSYVYLRILSTTCFKSCVKQINKNK